MLALTRAVKKAAALLVAPVVPAAAPVTVSLASTPSEVAKAIRLSLIKWPSSAGGRVGYVPWLAINTPSTGDHAGKLHINLDPLGPTPSPDTSLTVS